MLKVLIVDDNINVIRCLRRLVDWEGLGYEVAAEAYDGVAAYKLALEIKPDVIISDIKMPYSDGTELCKKIRESMDNVEFIFLSAYEDFSVARLAIKYGVKEYILKPVDKKKIAALSNILSQIRQSASESGELETMLSGSNFGAQVLERLKSGDSAYFEKFFGELLDNRSGEYAIVRALCLKMINVLYDYFQIVGVSEDVIDERRGGLKSELENLKTSRDMLFYVRTLYGNVLQFSDGDRSKYHNVLISEIKDYVNMNYSDELLTVASIAEKFNFSVNYLGKLFKHYTGETLSAYITGVRIKKAGLLLRDTMLSVNEIARMTGYSSSNYFTKAFKAYENTPPSEYRVKSKLSTQKIKEIVEN